LRIAQETVVRFIRDLTSPHIRVEQCPLSPAWNALMQLATKPLPRSITICEKQLTSFLS
jgi:hypothetical protein